MNIKLATLVISILGVVGCAPSNPPNSVSDISSDSKKDVAAIKQEEDPPGCYSDETKELVKKLIKLKSEERFKQDIFFSNTICMNADEAGRSREIMAAGKRPYIISGEDCVSQIDRLILETEIERDNVRFPSVIPLVNEKLAGLNQLKENLLVVKDGKFSFNQYLAKSETRAPDGSSISCSLRLEPTVSSESTNSFYTRLVFINLRMYKQGENPERYYEYEFGWGD